MASAQELQIPYNFPSGRSLNYILYGTGENKAPVDLPSLVTGTPSYPSIQSTQFIEQRNDAVLTTLEGFNMQLGKNQYDVYKIGAAFNVPKYRIDASILQAQYIKANAGTKTDNFVATVQKVGLGIILAVDAWLLAMFVGPATGPYGDAAVASSSGSGASATPITIDTQYFGFEPDTMGTLGLSEAAPGAQTLTPQASALLAGGPAPALAGGTTGILSSIAGGVSSLFMKVSDFFVKDVLGTLQNTVLREVLPSPSPPSYSTPVREGATVIQQVPNMSGGGSGFYNPNTAAGETGNGWLVFGGILAGVVLLVAFLKGRG